MRAILIAAVFTAAQSPPQKALPKWQVDQWDLGCVASLFAPGEKDARLEIFTGPGNDQLAIAIMDPTWKESTFGKDREAVEAVFEPGTTSIKGGSFYKGRLDRVEKLHFGASSHDYLDRLAQAKSLSVRRSSHEVGQMKLPGAPRMVAALRKCEDESLQEWGIDVAAWRALRKPPKPLKPLGSLISDADYPEIPKREGAEGRSVARLEIGLDGNVAGCKIVATARYRVLDERTCSIMTRRARFEPALDTSGKAVVAPYVVNMLWTLHPLQPEGPSK